jgi:hypothetical protein
VALSALLMQNADPTRSTLRQALTAVTCAHSVDIEEKVLSYLQKTRKRYVR